MTKEEILQKLRTDPAFLIDVILENNLPGVQMNLMQVGLTPGQASKEDCKKIILKLLTEGRLQDFSKVLKTKFQPGKLPPGYDEILIEEEERNKAQGLHIALGKVSNSVAKDKISSILTNR